MMAIQPVILWTDALLFLLIAVAAVFTVYTMRREHLRAPWREVGRSPAGMTALVILVVYIVIGVLDSLHYRPAGAGQGGGGNHNAAQVRSALDGALSYLRHSAEKTYSAPLATHLFNKQTVIGSDGQERQVYPRLAHGGAHLEDADQRWSDIGQRALTGGALGLVGWLALAGWVIAGLAARMRQGAGSAVRILATGQTELPWRAMLVTTALLCLLLGVVGSLSTHYHVLGTDKVGEDVLYQSLKSVRTGLMIGTLTTLVMLPFALALGMMAGYFGRWVDDLIQYIYTTLNSIPHVLLIAAAVLMVQVYIETHADQFATVQHRADLRLLALCIILGITSWTGLCRLLRGESLKLRQLDYVEASLAFGVRHFTILGRHILPNVMHIVLITVVLDFSGLVLAEAVLTYVGVGVDPSMQSWGNMINAARLDMAREPMVWWPLLAAFLFMSTMVLAANLFADAVRDAFDPRLRKQ